MCCDFLTVFPPDAPLENFVVVAQVQRGAAAAAAAEEDQLEINPKSRRALRGYMERSPLFAQ